MNLRYIAYDILSDPFKKAQYDMGFGGEQMPDLNQFFNIFKENVLDIVSIVLPDLDIIIKRISDNLFFFLKCKILSSSKLSKK